MGQAGRFRTWLTSWHFVRFMVIVACLCVLLWGWSSYRLATSIETRQRAEKRLCEETNEVRQAATQVIRLFQQDVFTRPQDYQEVQANQKTFQEMYELLKPKDCGGTS